MSAITKYLPKRRLSRWTGKLVHWEGPSWWARLTISTFARMYKINLEESEKPIHEYKSLGDFFIRRLKMSKRPLAEDAWAVHPADSRITQYGVIHDGKLIQAKGSTFSLEEFTQDPEALKKWQGGFFITYYLCPTDYHRVHSAVDGDITGARYIPGHLWPVNDWSTANVPNLFAINERVLVEIETDLGSVAEVFVGATNVGQICLSFDSKIRGNQKGVHIFQHHRYEPEIDIERGAELGYFRMGSTVVMIYPPTFTERFQDKLNLGPLVQVNSALTKI